MTDTGKTSKKAEQTKSAAESTPDARGTAVDAPALSPPPAASKDRHSQGDHQWRQLAVACLGLLALVNGGLALYAYLTLANLEKEIDVSLWRTEQRYEALDAQIEFGSRRRQMLLGLRDEILSTNPSLDWSEAYRYAALAVAASEKYASVDPVLLVSIGIVESSFDPEAESVAGARGLYQLFPSTTRLLSRSLGWEYTEKILVDPAKNTEMAALYLETLFAAHDDLEMVLTEYKEGALQAGYLRSGRDAMPKESRHYLSEVMDTYQKLVAKHGSLRGLGEEQLMTTEGLEVPEGSRDQRVDTMVTTGAQ